MKHDKSWITIPKIYQFLFAFVDVVPSTFYLDGFEG